MSCLSGLLSCCLPTRSSPPKSTTGTQQPPAAPHQHVSSSSSPFNPDTSQVDDGYSQVVPLPRYTPRPMSIQEKTLEAHMRDPPVSSTQFSSSMIADEKQRLAWEEGISPDSYHPEEVTSDVSSAISFPSSYGNTSTATRETPPPPYSPPFLSPAPSRSASISSGNYPPMSVITQPPPVFQRPDAGARGQFTPARHSVDEQLTTSRPRRFSWESR